MRLLHTSALMQSVPLLIILLFAGLALDFVLRIIVEEEVDERLQQRMEDVCAMLAEGGVPVDPDISVTRTGESTGTVRTTVQLPDEEDGELESWRQLRTVRDIKGKRLAIRIRSSLIEWEDFSQTIFLVFLAIALVVVAGGFVAGTVVSRRLWRPFFRNLEKLKSLSVRDDHAIEWADSDIEEFRELAEALAALEGRLRQEYHTLKEFTENASHELQTPLSIIRSKLERLREQAVGNAEIEATVESAFEAAERLLRLNRGLLLLARIENRQFDLDSEVDLTVLVETQYAVCSDMLAPQHRRLLLELQSRVTVKGSEALCEILVGNLFSNALRHAVGPGDIVVRLDEEVFELSNPGPALPFPPEQLYQRFRKGRPDSPTPGLGLAIAREIAVLHGWRLDHHYEAGRHQFTVRFRL